MKPIWALKIHQNSAGIRGIAYQSRIPYRYWGDLYRQLHLKCVLNIDKALRRSNCLVILADKGNSHTRSCGVLRRALTSW